MAKNVINNKIMCKFAPAMSNEAVNIENSAPEQSVEQPMTQNTEQPVEQPSGKAAFKVCAWLGALSTIGAWLSLIFSGSAAFFLALGGVVVSAFGARSPKGLVRDMAITAIVASAVLIVVFGIFYGVLYYIDKTLA